MTSHREAKDLIAQIENLNLPKRQEKRRTVYLNEKFRCRLHSANQKGDAQIVDLSEKGLAVVQCTDSLDFLALKGQSVDIEIRYSNNEFVIPAEIINISNVIFENMQRRRVGFAFSLSICDSIQNFHEKIGEEIISLRNSVKPLMWCDDPFFFNETVLMQVIGITAQGMELQLSSRVKSILPNIPLKTKIFIPYLGEFSCDGSNSFFLYKSKQNTFRIFFKFKSPNKNLLNALSEHLLLFEENLSPNILRKKNFLVGELKHSLTLTHTIIPQDILETLNLKPTLIAPNYEKNSKSFKPLKNARSATIKLGRQFIGIMHLFFPEMPASSLLAKRGFNIMNKDLKQMEVLNFYLSKDVYLSDTLIWLVKNFVKIAAQSLCHYIYLEACQEIIPVLEKLGFKRQDSHIIAKKTGNESERLDLLSLAVKDVILLKNKAVSKSVWDKIYRDLYNFFKAQYS